MNRTEQDVGQTAEAPALSRPRAIMLGWLVLGLVNCIVVQVDLGLTSDPWTVRILHHLFDIGQLCAAGLVVCALDAVGLRWGPFGRWALVALGLASALLGVVVAQEDLSGVGELAGERLAAWISLGLAGALGLSVPILVGWVRRAARPRWRWGAIAIGLGLGVLNGLLLPRLYTGLHLIGACWAAILIGGGLAGLRIPAVQLPRAVRWGARAVGALVMAWTVVIPPPNTVVVRLLATPGAVFTPYLIEAQAAFGHYEGVTPTEDQWFADRKGLPDIPPTKPALVDAPVVLLIFVDCLRADLLQGDRYASQLPVLHELRDRSVFFSHAWAPGPATGPSISAVFAGRYYSQLYWTKRPQAAKVFPYDDPQPRFPELLAAAEIPTVELASLRVFTNEWGIVRGFSEQRRSRQREAPARWLVDQALERLGQVGTKPLFLHTHFMEPHAPYDKGGKQGTPFERFVREVAVVDRELGRLLHGIDERGLAERTIILLAGDHGEAFGEHNTQHHATTMYEELLRVPLLIRVPHLAARHVEQPVSLIDLGPTILDLMGQVTPATYLGQSLVPYVRGSDEPLGRPIAAESGRFDRAMLFPDGYKLIYDTRRHVVELYDLGRDPTESRNLYDEAEPSHRQRLAKLQAFFSVHEFRREGYRTPYRR